MGLGQSKNIYDEFPNVIQDEIDELKYLQASMNNGCSKDHADKLGEIIRKIENKTCKQLVGLNSFNQENTHVPPTKRPKTDVGLKNQSLHSNVRKSRQKVKIMNPIKTSSSQDFVCALMKMMNDFDFKYSERNDEMDDNVPLIVVCPNVSRLQPDVDLAIQSVQRSSPYVVIILHIGSEKSLPRVPSEQKLHNYKSITFIDMGFNDQGYIYECQHNAEANVQLRSYIGDTGTNHPKTSTSGSSTIRKRSPPRSYRAPFPIRATRPPSPPPKLLSDKPWRPFSKSGDELQESVLKSIKKLNPTKVPLLLILGHKGAGKSSFINSCLSVSAGSKKALVNTGSAGRSHSLVLKTYKDDGILKNFRLVECMGIEPQIGHGFHTDDIVYLLQGHVKETYKFDPEKPLTTDSKFYRKEPKFKHKTHCAVFVLDARTIHGGIPKAYNTKIQYLQEKIGQKDVPRVLILTQVDLLCDEVQKDASNIFRSLKVEKTVKTASAVFGIDMASIHPVINYEEDFELTTAKNIPILLALRQIMQYACDREEQVRNESERESSSENDSD